jgi:hypothetical protein
LLALALIAKQPDMLWLVDRIGFAFGLPSAISGRTGPASNKATKSKENKSRENKSSAASR